MKKNSIKDVIDELIYEAFIGKNPFKVGDLVRLRPDVLNGAGPNVQWRNTLQQLLGKTGKISRVFPNSKHVNVKYDHKWKSNDEHEKEHTVDTIGVNYTQLIPANNPDEVDEGVGWGDPKKIAKDPKHTTNKLTGKVQRWTVKYNENVNMSEIKTIIKEILNEAKRYKFRKVYGPKKDKPNPLEDDHFQQWLFKNENQLKMLYNFTLKSNRLEAIDLPMENFFYSMYQKIRAELNESENPDKNYIIFARSGNVATYYVNSPTQGERMVQFGQSTATKFSTEEKVRNKIAELKLKYKGITNWDYELVPSDEDKSFNPLGNPKGVNFNLGHQVFKPVKKNEEWIVRWTYNGKTQPNYSYYTDNKNDAVNTYELMLRNAESMNRKGEPPYEPEP